MHPIPGMAPTHDSRLSLKYPDQTGPSVTNFTLRKINPESVIRIRVNPDSLN